MAGTEFKKGFATSRTSFRVPATVRYCTARLIVDGETWVLVDTPFDERLTAVIEKHESDRTKIECRKFISMKGNSDEESTAGYYAFSSGASEYPGGSSNGSRIPVERDYGDHH
jgi:hypothetical protein